MTEEKIYLHVEREGDAFVVRDQYGRMLAMQKSVVVSTGMDEATEVHLTFLDSSRNGNFAHTNRIGQDK